MSNESRAAILENVRRAIARTGPLPPDLAPPRLFAREMPAHERVALFVSRLEATGGTAAIAKHPAAVRESVTQFLAGRAAVCAHDTRLRDLTGIPNTVTAELEPDRLRAQCTSVEVGITAADYGLADTGSIVVIAAPEQPRLLSLLPPVHLAILAMPRLFVGLDDLLLAEPSVLDRSSSMVLITGSSRTADIEQILVRGVHGPGHLHVLLVDDSHVTL